MGFLVQCIYLYILTINGLYLAISSLLYVMGRLGHEQFLFYFLLFSDFIGILFSFSFLFFVDDEEARDIAVT